MIPLRRLFGFAAAFLHWSADQFWHSTPHEFYAAMEGLDPKRSRSNAEDVAALEESIDADAELSRRIAGQD